MLKFLVSLPWPLYPGILAFCVGFILQVMMTREVDHQKLAQFRTTSVGHPLAGRLGTSILTERGLKLHRWFLASAAVFVVSLLLAVALYAKR